MQITRATDAALRVLMVLAVDAERQVTVRELADELSVPRQHLAKVVQSLAREGWVSTTRGRAGGLRITESGAAVTAGQVVRTLGGVVASVDCFDPPCPLVTAGCRLQHALSEAQDAFLASLDARTMHELATAAPTGA
ncbi:MAG: Rrf2 family transcriptional regulator [Nocardioidaceae bacterium]